MTKQLSITLVFDYSYSLNPFSFFDIGQRKGFVNFSESKKEFAKAYKNHIRQELNTLVSLTSTSKTSISAYFSGTFLKLLQEVDKDMVKKLNVAAHAHLELLTGAYANSLSPVFSLKSTLEEVNSHSDLLKDLFSVKTSKSYLFENVYSNDISKQLSQQGIKASFACPIDWYLDGETDIRVLKAQDSKGYAVLLPDNDLGVSVFNNKNQKSHFLQFDIAALMQLGGLEGVVGKLRRVVPICSLDDQISNTEIKKTYNIKTPVMSGLKNIDLDTLRSNALQNSAIKHYYSLKTKINSSIAPELFEVWLLLGHSDYFLQMGRNNNDTAYDFYSKYMNILNDLALRLDT